jgi:lysophospholipase L1-like esterase
MKTSKAIVLSICLALITISAYSQTTAWDSTYRPTIYAGKVGQFKYFPKSNKDIIFLGNSIMTYTDWNELLGLKTAKNRGIPGDITFGVLERLGDVIEGKPAKIFILIGINDITSNIPDSVILNNYKKIITRIKAGSPLTKIYFHTLFPINDAYTALKGKTGHILNVNRMLKELCVKERITLIDVYPHLLNDKGVLDPQYTFDGLHMNDLGYKLWGSILKAGNYLARINGGVYLIK